MPVAELLKLDTDGNLRDYIPAHPGKSRNTVHKAIGSTLQDKHDRFIQLSGGLTVSATEISIDDSQKMVTLTNGSIINGAQTQGEIRRYIEELEQQGDQPDRFHTRVEFMVDTDKEFIVEAAIARNSSTNVQKLSMVGKKGYIDDLNKEFQSIFSSKELSTSETDTAEHYVDTKRLLQVLWALIPEDMLPDDKQSPEARLKSYKNQAYCLIDFEKEVLAMLKGDDTEATARYEYFRDMAGVAWKEYLKWRHHAGWQGQRLQERTKAIKRTEDAPNGIVVADGVIFPILSAMSLFVEKDAAAGKWRINVPAVFDEEGMIDAARDQLSAHKGQPTAMGRDAGVYAGLMSFSRMVQNAQKLVTQAQQPGAA